MAMKEGFVGPRDDMDVVAKGKGRNEKTECILGVRIIPRWSSAVRDTLRSHLLLGSYSGKPTAVQMTNLPLQLWLS
jgi:hypothetical protein